MKIPGVGRSSQIDSDDSVVIETLSTKRRSTVLRIDRQSGETIWNVEISCVPTKQQHECDTGSSNLPAADGSRVNGSASAREKMGLPAVDWNGGIECAKSACGNESEHGILSSMSFANEAANSSRQQPSTAVALKVPIVLVQATIDFSQVVKSPLIATRATLGSL